MKITDKLIAFPGIIIPNSFGEKSFILYVLGIVFIKLFNNRLIGKLINKILEFNFTSLTLMYVFIHIIGPFLFNDSFFNSEIKGLIFMATSSLILAINKREKNLRKLESFIKIIIAYMFLVAVYVFFTKGIIFNFTSFFLKQFQFNAIYAGSLFVIIFAIFKDRIIKLLSAVLIILAGSGTAISGFIVYLLISNLKNIFSLKIKYQKIILIIIFISFLIFVLVITQFQRGRSFYDIENIDRYILQFSFLKYCINEFSLTDFLFGSTHQGSLSDMINYVDSPIYRAYLILKEGQNNQVLPGKLLHNEHLRIFFHFGIIGYSIFIRQLFLLLGKNKPLFVTFFWMISFSPLIYVNSIYVFLVLISNYKIDENTIIENDNSNINNYLK